MKSVVRLKYSSIESGPNENGSRRVDNVRVRQISCPTNIGSEKDRVRQISGPNLCPYNKSGPIS